MTEDGVTSSGYGAENAWEILLGCLGEITSARFNVIFSIVPRR